MATRIGVVIHRDLLEVIFSEEDQQRLNDLGEVRWTESRKPISTEQACELLRDCEIGLGGWDTPYPNVELVAACPKLRLWEHAAGSVTKMFGPHLKGRGIIIASCNPALAECVAEATLGIIILSYKGYFENVRQNRGEPTVSRISSRTLFGATIGVIGASSIGRKVIEYLKAFPCDILLYDPYVSAEQAADMGAVLANDLTELCAVSDVVSLHTPDLPSTCKLLGAVHFQAMKDDAVFINTSRGCCIDEQALVAELEKGRLRAYLDVTDPEPPANDSPLRSLPNAYYSSHITGGMDKRLGQQAVDDIAAFLGGESPRYVVTEEMLGRIA